MNNDIHHRTKRIPILVDVVSSPGKYYYCPMCFNIISYEIDSKKNFIPKCNFCDWNGGWDDCLDDGEAKNFKRIKIMDDILNEKNTKNEKIRKKK